MASLLLLNKPFNTLCQFTDDQGRKTLSDYIDTRQYPNYYPAGRLDYDSEGLVALTNEGAIQHRLADPKFKLPKTYWVQVEGIISELAIRQLQHGVTLNDGPTQPCKAVAIAEPVLWPRTPPIRERQNSPTTWLEITLTEGRNRQVRRMTAAVGLPTLRLVRKSIGPWSIENLTIGEYRVEPINLPTPPKIKRPRTNKTFKSGQAK
jgi:23S rRNA pseudouridine2457 synthase